MVAKIPNLQRQQAREPIAVATESATDDHKFMQHMHEKSACCRGYGGIIVHVLCTLHWQPRDWGGRVDSLPGHLRQVPVGQRYRDIPPITLTL